MILSNRIHSSLLKLDIINVEKHRETNSYRDEIFAFQPKAAKFLMSFFK